MLKLPADLKLHDLVPDAVVHVTGLEQVGATRDVKYADYVSDEFGPTNDVPVLMLRYRLIATAPLTDRPASSLMPDISFAAIDENGAELTSQMSSASILESHEAQSLEATAGPWPLLAAATVLQLIMRNPVTDLEAAILQVDVLGRTITQV